MLSIFGILAVWNDKLVGSVQLKVGFKSTMEELDIRDVADLSGVSPSALRFYEKKGLIRAVGRNGLRRQYHSNVLVKLELIALGKAVGFTLDEIATMLNEQGRIAIDRELLLLRAREIDSTLRQLKRLSEGLKHVARCQEQEHMQCETFRDIVQRGLRLLR